MGKFSLAEELFKAAQQAEKVKQVESTLEASKAVETVPTLLTETPKASPSIKGLADSVERALANHLSLPLGERASNSRNAREVISQHIGKTKDGKYKDLLGQNQKLLKTEQGIEGSQPLTLDDGRGVENIGLSLSPAYQEGKFNICPNSKSCKEACLGKTSGGNFFAGGGKDLEAMLGPRLAGYNKTQAFLNNPEEFAVRLNDEITAAKHIAAANGNHLGVRLNVLSDIHPKVWKPLMDAHPDVSFYDYTKLDTDAVAPNHHLTYSSTGVSQPAGYNGLNTDVVNVHQNWHNMRRRLDKGDNVAMAFSHKELVPENIIDEETGKSYRVISGDSHDFRPIDMTPEGDDGVIIGLKNKAATTSNANAAAKTKGFMVHYDPQILKEKGKRVLDEEGNPIAQNKIVTIPKQPRRTFTLTNDNDVVTPGE